VIIAVLLKPLRSRIEAGVSRLIDWLVGGDGVESLPAKGGHLHLSAAGLVGTQDALVSFYRTFSG
jgi:hypothetical protein